MGSKRSRDERKERTAQLREQQRAKDRRQRRIVYGIAVPLVLIIIAIVPLTNWWHAHQRGIQHSVGYVRAASKTAKAAGCTGVRNDREMATSVIKSGTTVDYASLVLKAGQQLPPTSGPRDANLLPDTPAFIARSAAPHPERAIGNLDHGYVIVWYDNDLPAAQVKLLQSASSQNSRTLIVPWTRSIFPNGQHVVFTAWDRTQRCKTVAAAALTSFVGTYGDDASGTGWGSPSAPTPNGAASPTPTPSATASAAASVTATPQPSASASPSAANPTPSASVTVPTASLPKVSASPAR
jgi:cell division septation protein DedD